MHVLIVTFTLTDLDDPAYRTLAEAAAPAIARTPGLIAKVWLADEAAACYGGVYLFASRDAAARYRVSEAMTALRANPHVTDLVARLFDTIEPATALTRGGLTLAPTPAPAGTLT
jgi:hypothetical protein